MKEYTIHLGEKDIKVNGEGFELDDDGMLFITTLERVTAIFNLNNIVGFEEHII